MRRLALLLVVPLLAGCASSDGSSGKSDEVDAAAPDPSAAAPSDDPTFPGGNALSTYEGSPTYPWRVRIIYNAPNLLSQLRQIKPLADDGDFSNVLDTCLDLSEGKTTEQVERNVRLRFSDSDKKISGQEAVFLVKLSKTACPKAG